MKSDLLRLRFLRIGGAELVYFHWLTRCPTIVSSLLITRWRRYLIGAYLYLWIIIKCWVSVRPNVLPVLVSIGVLHKNLNCLPTTNICKCVFVQKAAKQSYYYLFGCLINLYNNSYIIRSMRRNNIVIFCK